MNAVVRILQLGNLISAFIVPTIEAALKIKHSLELDPDMQVNITNLTGEAIAADEETMRIIAAWKAKHGIA